jgi:hypothetical protein
LVRAARNLRSRDRLSVPDVESLLPIEKRSRRLTGIIRKECTVRRSIVLLVLLVVGLAPGVASADPINSPQTSSGTLMCGSVTYTIVSPNHAPVGQMVTANGSDSTQVQIMIVDKAGTSFPSALLTQCTFLGPDGFTAYLLITPVSG